MFDSTSRYSDPAVPNDTYVTSDGRTLPYRPLRTVPRSEGIPIRTEVDSKTGERPDQLSSRTLSAPDLYWRLYDANTVVDPLSINARWSRRWRIPS